MLILVPAFSQEPLAADAIRRIAAEGFTVSPVMLFMIL